MQDDDLDHLLAAAARQAPMPSGELMERVLADALVLRGTNYGTNATLFGFRTPDVTRVPLDAGDVAL
ncbi:MAG: hypothetical protein J0L76_20585, partial [Rhodobacterales bacterium]|nr:hypothetical protein [Rhodobacterales bacterium]